MRGKILKEDMIEIWDVHCKGKYPREFCGISIINKNGKELKRVTRNICIRGADILYNFVEDWEFRDVYISVYSFGDWHDDSKVRKLSARVDTLFIDLDNESDPRIAFKEAKKLTNYLINKKSIVPRVYFSGSKGFHVFIDFPEVDLFYKQESLRVAVSRLVKKLNLKCVDYQVVELARVSRLPLTINTKTGYRCTPIDSHKFLELDFDTLLRFCKSNYCKIEVIENKEFADFLRRIDMLLITQAGTVEARKQKEVEVLEVEPRKLEKKDSNWRRKRIEYYAKVLREKGYLSLDPLIIKIHGKNARADPGNPGSIEHLARVHLVLLMIEEGFTDEQIHEVFKHARDYDYEKTQYYIEYNRKWIKEKEKIEQGVSP